MEMVECESCDGRRYVEDDCTIIYPCHKCGLRMLPLKAHTEPVAEVPSSGLLCLLAEWEKEAKHRRQNAKEELKAGNDKHAEKEGLIALMCEKHVYELNAAMKQQA